MVVLKEKHAQLSDKVKNGTNKEEEKFQLCFEITIKLVNFCSISSNVNNVNNDGKTYIIERVRREFKIPYPSSLQLK